MTPQQRPYGITAISCFFCFGALMSGLAAVMLLFPGSSLDLLWRVNPHAHEGFAAMGNWSVLLMAFVCGACFTAAVGLWLCRRWGLLTALAILVANLAGDTANALLARDWRTLIGLPIAGLMIVYLFKKRSFFARRGEP